MTKKKTKKEKEKSRPVGRPKWIPSAEDMKQVESYGALGMTSQQIADCMGISAGHMCAMQNEFPEFYDAIKRGKAKGIAMVTSELIKNVKAKNVTAQIFYLKCQAKWREESQEIKNQQEQLKESFEALKEEVQRCMKPI